jgi:hypothetical protein
MAGGDTGFFLWGYTGKPTSEQTVQECDATKAK